MIQTGYYTVPATVAVLLGCYQMRYLLPTFAADFSCATNVLPATMPNVAAAKYAEMSSSDSR